MNKNKSFLYIFLLLLFISSMYPVHAIHSTSHVKFNFVDSYWGTINDQIEVTPGDKQVPFNIVISHSNGGYQISGINAALILPETISVKFTDGSTSKSVGVSGVYNAGDQIILTYYLDINENAKIATHNVHLQIDFDIKRSNDVITGDTYVLAATLDVLGKSNLKYDLSPNVFEPGKFNNFIFKVSNVGTASVSAVNINFTTQIGVIYDLDQELNIQKLAPGESKSFSGKLYVDPNQRGVTSKATISTSYTTINGDKHSETKNISYSINSLEKLFSIKAMTETKKLTLYIAYKGNDSLKNVEIITTTENTLENTVLGNSLHIIDTINSNSVTKLELVLNPKSNNGELILNVTIKYVDDVGSIIEEKSTLIFNVVVPPEKASLTTELDRTNIVADQISEGKITITNEGMPLSDVQITATVSSPFGLVSKSQWNIDQLNGKEKIDLETEIFAPSSTLGNIGTITLEISYIDSLSNSNQRILETRDIDFAVLVPQMITSSIILSIEETALINNQINEVTVSLTNQGKNPVYDVELNMLSIEGVNLIGLEGRWIYDVIQPDETKKIKFKVMLNVDDVKTAITTNFNINYIDRLGSTFREDHSLGLTIGGIYQSPIAIEITNTDINAGEINNLEILIKNNDENNLQNVNVEIDLEGSGTLYLTDGHFKLGSLNSGSSKKIEVPLLTSNDLTGAMGTIKLKINYVEEGIVRTETKDLSYSIRGIIDLRIKSVKQSNSAQSNSLLLSGIIVNSGNNEANFVSIKPQLILRHNMFNFAPNEILIGDISAGSQVPFSFIVKAQSDVKEINEEITLHLTYKNDRGEIEEKIEKIKINFTFDAPEDIRQNQTSMISLTNTNMMIGALLIIIGLIAIWNWKIRNRNK